MSSLSRRTLARRALKLAALWTVGSRVRGATAGDRGLGGTGAAPDESKETLGQDRGIGGTGVVGTIRRFGSVVVNDLRVAYPGDVRVTIDGARATPGDLRIGQVVRVLARTRTGTLETQAIAVENEVVGPVDAIGRRELMVLGQRVLVDTPLPRGLRLGQTVAVGGLRRPDGTIAASLVARVAAGTPARLVGPVKAGAEGALMIGHLRILGLRPSFAGRRLALTGHRIAGAFHVSRATDDPIAPFAHADRLSIEGYVARSGDELRFASGLSLQAGHAGSALADGEVMRAVVTAALNEHGGFTATAVHADHGHVSGAGARGAPPSRASGIPARSGAQDRPSGGAAPGAPGPSQRGTGSGGGAGGGGGGASGRGGTAR